MTILFIFFIVIIFIYCQLSLTPSYDWILVFSFLYTACVRDSVLLHWFWVRYIK